MTPTPPYYILESPQEDSMKRQHDFRVAMMMLAAVFLFGVDILLYVIAGFPDSVVEALEVSAAVSMALYIILG